MSTEMQTKVQASPAQSFSPVQPGLLQRQCALCNTPGLMEDSEKDKEKLTLQRSSVDQAGTTAVPPIVHEALRSPGQPLDAATLAYMEPRFGHDFSKVGIHSTGPGVVQTKLKINEPGDFYDQEADREAEKVSGVPQHLENEIYQPKFASGLTGNLQAKTEAPQNKTGMPDHLKSGLENLSSMNLSSVRVHHNSSKPAQLNALAYTQGQEIHVGPGQDEHLPHEGWHAVQQMQGRVKPTMQAKSVSINDDKELEREADLMGEKALVRMRVSNTQRQANGANLDRKFAKQTLDKVARSDYWETSLRTPIHSKMQIAQLKGDDDTLTTAGNTYKYKVERKGDRWSFDVTFSWSRTKPNPVKGKTERVKAQLGDAGISRSRSYKNGSVSSANSMSAALAKASINITELMPGVNVKVGTKALEAKLEKGEIDFNVFELAFFVKGELTKAIQGKAVGDAIIGTELGKLILQGTAIKVQGNIKIKIDPADVARLIRMVKLNKEIAKNTKTAVKAKRKLDALHKENKRIRDKLKKRGSKMKHRTRKKLRERLTKNGKKQKALTKAINKNNKATKVLLKSYRKVARGLKTKAGRLVGAAVKRVGGRLLLKLVPGLNVLLFALDVVEISSALWKLITGKAELGFDGDGGQTGRDAAGGKGSEGESDDQADASKSPASIGKSAGSSTKRDAGAANEEENRPGPEIDIKEDIAHQPSTGTSGKFQKSHLHPFAQDVWKAIKSKSGKGVKFTADDLAQLNEIIPKDLTSQEFGTLLELLENTKGIPATDVFTILGAIQEYISRLRRPEPVAIVTSEGKQEKIAISGAAKKSVKKPPNLKKIRKFLAGAKTEMVKRHRNFFATVSENFGIGSVEQRWVAIKSSNGIFYAGNAAVVGIQEFQGVAKYEIQVQPTMFYNESGAQLGPISFKITVEKF